MPAEEDEISGRTSGGQAGSPRRLTPADPFPSARRPRRQARRTPGGDGRPSSLSPADPFPSTRRALARADQLPSGRRAQGRQLTLLADPFPGKRRLRSRPGEMYSTCAGRSSPCRSSGPMPRWGVTGTSGTPGCSAPRGSLAGRNSASGSGRPPRWLGTTRSRGVRQRCPLRLLWRCTCCQRQRT